MKLLAVLGILLVVGSIVAYIDRSAVARVERDRLIEALKTKQKNAAIVANIKEAKAEEQKKRTQTLEAKLAMLEAQIPEPSGTQCPSGCTIKWTDE